MIKEIGIWGLYKLNGKVERFTGKVMLEDRGNSIYYNWILMDIEEKFIGGKAVNIAFQQIPEGQDKYEFAKSHAIDGIKKYVIGREKLIYQLYISDWK